MRFFFQAEDGIRDLYVTGVQTCALPICFRHDVLLDVAAQVVVGARQQVARGDKGRHERLELRHIRQARGTNGSVREWEIGRASCRERGEIWVAAVALVQAIYKTSVRECP